jgi:hypothetical protein
MAAAISRFLVMGQQKENRYAEPGLQFGFHRRSGQEMRRKRTCRGTDEPVTRFSNMDPPLVQLWVESANLLDGP